MTPRRTARRSTALLIVLCAALSGCGTTVYHTTMAEMTQSQREVTAVRVGEAKANHISARAAFDRALDQLRAADEAMGDETNAEHVSRASLDQCINRFELQAWNLKRRIASVRDVGEAMFGAESQAQGGGQYRDMLERMDEAQRQTQRMLEGLQHHSMLLTADVDGTQIRSLNAVPNPMVEAEAFIARIDAAVASADALLALLQ